jgi:hypothetical protein
MTVLSTGPLLCFRCEVPFPTRGRIERSAVCPKCDADLHCCRNCKHYSAHAHNECNEPQAEWVLNKDRANSCDYFEPSRGQPEAGASTRKQEDARAQFENLFKTK